MRETVRGVTIAMDESDVRTLPTLVASSESASSTETEAPSPRGRAKHLRLAATPTAPPSLKSPELYLNRELTWLAFNRRVFQEALEGRNPPLERVKFLAIVAANLDEFFMKRIGGLKQQVGAGMHDLTPDGRSPQQQIVECYAEIREQEAAHRQALDVLLA